MKKTFIFKPTLECNMRCGYCYEFRRPERRILSQKTLQASNVIDIFERFARLFPYGEFLWLFHGGEPLLIGEKEFEKILEHTRMLNSTKNVSFKIAIQSNATLVTESWIELWKKYGDVIDAAISVSVDGPPLLNDLFRKFFEKKQSAGKEVENAIRTLRAQNISTNTITVVGSHNISAPKATFEYLNEIGSCHQKYIPCYNVDSYGNFSSHSITPVEYANFMCQIFDLWKENMKNDQGKWILVDPLIPIIENIFIGESKEWCEYSSHKCDNFFTIFPNGDLTLCESYSLSESKDIIFLGNLNGLPDKDLITRIRNPNRNLTYLEFKEKIMRTCQECDLYSLCKGGCLYYRHKFNSISRELGYSYCKGRRILITYIKESIGSCIPFLEKAKN